MTVTAEKAYKVWEAVWKWLLIPLATGIFYIASAYADTHYVSKQYFDKAMNTLSDDKRNYASEQKQELKSISEKLDLLLQGNAANAQRFSDMERRLSRLEDKVDKAK